MDFRFPLPPRHFAPSVVSLAVLFGVAGCGGCGPGSDPDAGPRDMGEDVIDIVEEMGPPDLEETDADADSPLTGPVEIDLAPYLEDSPLDDGGRVRVYRAESDSDLVDGAVASGRPGDWVLENGVSRFVVQGDTRAMSACPYGGHLIDGAPLDIESDGDTLGEICFFVNAGSTMVPETFEVIQDGSDGGPGVLAVSGSVHLLDWINFTTMAADLGFGAIGELAIGPNTIPPIYVTTYFILRPGERGIRVVDAMRNDGESQVDLLTGHMIGGGGDGTYWNPLSAKQGFGEVPLGLDSLDGEPMPWLGYAGSANSSWAYVPRPREKFDFSIPVGGAYLPVSGIAVAFPDVSSILDIMLATESRIPELDEVKHLAPGEVAVMEHWTFVGDGSLSTILDQIYPLNDVATGIAAGRVTHADGEPAEDALVTAIDPDGAPLSQARAGADGSFEMELPPGTYELRGRVGNNVVERQDVVVMPGSPVDSLSLELPSPSNFVVHVRDPSGAPVPGRVTVLCDECPGRPTQQEVDLDTEKLPETWAGVFYADVATGDAQFSLPAGTYRVVVSRGLTWSVWPEGAIPDGGFEVTATPGETIELNAEIAEVVDMTGLLSADFHVHTINSHDSNTPHIARVRGFVSDGLDVAVSSDHDYIADYAPAVAALGAEDEIATIVGIEISTSDIGHFNGFPLEYDPEHTRGGAVDWGNGDDYIMTPEEMFAWIDEHPGEQVVQVNHADSLGLFKNILADPLRGISLIDPTLRRLPPAEPDPETGDTGLWSEAFTAYEVQNGNDLPQFWALFRWWLTMVGRGFAPSGTAVTDTHRRYDDIGTTPRSVVTVPESSDSPGTLDIPTFVDAINAGKVIGTNGPVLRVALRNADDERATYGETLDGSSGEVTAEIQIQTPMWMEVDTIDVYTNEESVVGDPGRPNEEPVPPSSSVDVNVTGADRVDVATGADRTHQRIEKTVEIPLVISEDSYFVFLVRGETSNPMTPIIRETETRPFAWTNPIFVDFDGNGYDNPPLGDLASTMPAESPRPAGRVSVPLTAEMILHSIEENTCTEHAHGHQAP